MTESIRARGSAYARGPAADVLAGLTVALLGLVESFSASVYGASDRAALVVVGVLTGIAVGLSRRAPGAALAVVWLLLGLQVATGTQIMLVELGVAAVAFGTARWGGPATLVASAVSIPAVAVMIVLIGSSGLFPIVDSTYERVLIGPAQRFGSPVLLWVGLLGIFVLGTPWLAGLALRFHDRAQVSRVSLEAAEEQSARAGREVVQAQEIARLQEEQARLARDVHDVVGHSLAVILAQAESAQFLPRDDTEALQRTMANIVSSARSSLQDVRAVLASTSVPGHRPSGPGGLDSLVDGLRASGHPVVSSEVGAPQPLPPELDVVAFRVLQEMLTNAIRHGRRGSPVHVERHWEGELRLEVRNVVGEEETRPLHLDSSAAEGGHGLDGMRRRLEAVGGRLDVRRRQEGGEATFTATAWVPVRARE